MRSSLARSAFFLWVARLLIAGMSFVTTVLVSRFLGPEARGLCSAAAVLGAMGVQLINCGLAPANVFFAARDRRLLPILLGNSLSFAAAAGGIAVALVWSVFALWPATAPVSGTLLVLALAWVPIGLGYLYLEKLLTAIQAIGRYNQIELTCQALGLVSLIAAWRLGWLRPETVTAIALAVLAARLVWAFLFLSRVDPLAGRASDGSDPDPRLRVGLTRLPRVAISLPQLWQSLAFGFKAHLAALFAFVFMKGDLLLVERLLDAKQAGFYAIAISLVDLLSLVSISAGLVLFPRFCALSDVGQRWRLARAAAWRMALVMAMATLTTALLAEPFIRAFFGKEFLPSVAAFHWLAPGIVLMATSSVLGQYLASYNMPVVTVIGPLVGAVWSVSANFFLIPALGLRGAALTACGAHGLVLMINLGYILWTRRVQHA